MLLAKLREEKTKRHTSERLKTDLQYFAENALKLRPKAGPIEPFVFNAAQLELHRRLEEQKAKTGMVRALVLKGRQMGVSTYVAARFYHKTIGSPGLRCVIIGHEKRASSNLFGIVKRYHDHLPDELRPSVGTSNSEELIFDQIDSGYLVSVATSEGSGRSATAQLLHGSEVAFWHDIPLQLAALFQIVPDLPETEIVIESTAFGFNDFHTMWRKAESGQSEFVPIFLPWSIEPGYRRPVDADFQVDSEEKKLAELYGLDKEQLAWRRAKISQLGNASLFQQEYPLTASEAFISSNFDSFIPASLVVAARKEKVEPFGPLIIGCDPAGSGPDRTSVAWRRGRSIIKVESRRLADTMETVGWLQRIIREDKPAKLSVDVGGLGAGIYDRLAETSSNRRILNAVNFAGRPVEPPPLGEDGKPAGGPANRRSEMWLNLKNALAAGRFSLPDSESLQSDICAAGYKYDSAGRLLLESKVDIRKRGLPSPDEGDACALCFSEPDGNAFVRDKNFYRDLSEKYKGAYI